MDEQEIGKACARQFPASLCLLISSGLEPESRNASKHTWRRHSARGRVTALNGKTVSKYLNPRPGEGGSPKPWESWRRAAEGWWRDEGQLSLLPPPARPSPPLPFFPSRPHFVISCCLIVFFRAGYSGTRARAGGKGGRRAWAAGGLEGLLETAERNS